VRVRTRTNTNGRRRGSHEEHGGREDHEEEGKEGKTP